MKTLSTLFTVMLVATAVGGCATNPSLQATDLSTVTASQKIAYPSVNEVTGIHALLSGGPFPPQILVSELHLPESCAAGERVAAVIIQHGSGNLNKRWYPELVEKLVDNGIATLVADSYSARNITSTSHDQTRLTGANRTHDTFSAFRALQAIPCIDPDRIGVTGYSFGGFVSRYMFEAVLAERFGGGHVLKASLPVYPSCSWQWKNPRLTKTKVHYLLADLDDYTPARFCLDNIRRLKEAGGDVSFTVYPGAHHGFIADKFYGHDPQSETFYGCGVSWVTEDGHYITPAINATTQDGWEAYNKAVYKRCVKRGATSGRNENARSKAMAFTVRFFKENL